MICPECNGMGETVYYVETARDENTVTMEQRKGICRTCNGSGEKPITNADRIRSMTDEELADFFRMWCRGMEDCADCHLYHEDCPGSCEFSAWIKWLQQPAEKPKEEA